MSEIKSVIIPQDQIEVWSEQEERFVNNYPSNFYIINALGDFVFYMTRDRAAAQKQANLDWDNKYTIRCARDQKIKSKLESGGQSVYATATRPKGSSRPPR